jgi:regulator of sigma E protease
MIAQGIIAILGISVLVIVHEAGHYLAARAFGMRVVRFSIGFGPVIAKWQPKDSPTVFQISAVPFLAYVQIAGMNPAEDNDPNDPELYPNKSVFARFVAIAGGPFANYLVASILVFGLALGGHLGPPSEPIFVQAVEASSPAAQAGLKPGDVILRADGKAVHSVEDLIEFTKNRSGQPTLYVIKRDGKELPPLTITPVKRNDRGIIGVSPRSSTAQLSFEGALAYSVIYPFELTVFQLEQFGYMWKKKTTEGVVGPVGMVKIVAMQAKSITELAKTLMAISVALGMFNLLPVPALDGGRLVFLCYEIITRRRANEKIETLVHAVGLVVLLCLIALVTLRDVAG